MALFILSRMLLITCAAWSIVVCVLKPRGVSLLKNVFYDPKKDFYCLDGSGVFPFYYINDDYCDCNDGSDEPGTSACPNGIFTCLNYGHMSTSIPSSKVNDGICDCCDTSDEYESSADCFNSCKEQGLLAIKEAIRVYDEYKEANATRKNYISEANAQKEVYKSHLNKLIEEEVEAMKIKLKLLDLKEKAEENEFIYLSTHKRIKEEQNKKRIKEMKLLQEQRDEEIINAEKAFTKLDLNKDGKIVISEIQSFQVFDYDDDGKVSKQEAMFYMHKKEEISLNEFLDTGWGNMKSAFTINELSYANNDNHQEFVTTSTSENSVDETITEDLLTVSEEEKNAAFEDAALKQKLYADAEKKVHDIQSDIWLLKKKLEGDYGHDSEFFVLHKLCFDFSDKRYLYRLCPFDKALQITKHNQDEVLLGLWNTWSGTKNKYSQMSYTKGSTCWNGPSRSILVDLQCGLENKILSVTEASRCQYVFEFATPTSCYDIPSSVKKIINEHTFHFI